MNKKIRNHFSIIIENILKFFWSLILLFVVYFVDFLNDIENSVANVNTMLIILGFLLLLIVIFIIFFLKWYKTTILVNEIAIVIDRNTWFRKVSNINIKDISTVDISQNILQKIFNTAKVQVDINSVVTADENDLKIVLKYNDALNFQKIVLKLMNNEEVINDKKITLDDYDFSYSFKQIIKHTIFSYNIVVFILSLLLYVPILLYSDYNNSALLFGFIMVVVPFIFGTVNSLFSYYGFKIKKGKNKINISYGYFTKKKYSMPYTKISGLKITQPLLARFFNLYSVELINIGYAEENYVSLLLPIESKKEVLKKLNILFPEIDFDFVSERQSKLSLIGYVFDYSFWLLITVVFCSFLNYVFALVVLLLWFIGIYLSFITKKISYKDKVLYITKGVYNKSIVICKTHDIQNISLKKNIILSKFKICRMDIVLQSNVINTNHSTGYFDINIFNKIIKEYK